MFLFVAFFNVGKIFLKSIFREFLDCTIQICGYLTIPVDVAVPFYSGAETVQIHLKDTRTESGLNQAVLQALPYHKIHASKIESQEL